MTALASQLSSNTGIGTAGANALAALSDAELLSATRAGDHSAYGELFGRHRTAGWRFAVASTGSPTDADDLVSEAFTKILHAIQQGNGPTASFRPYLLTTVRRLHLDRVAAQERLTLTPDYAGVEPGVPFQDPAVQQLESSMVTRAFQQLPQRWQSVLWLTEIERMNPRDVAPMLGVSANAISALLRRATDGLRNAYLSEHTTIPASDTCGALHQLLVKVARGTATAGQRNAIDAHASSCEHCQLALNDLTDIGSCMRASLAPAMLGAAATPYLAGAAIDITALPDPVLVDPGLTDAEPLGELIMLPPPQSEPLSFLDAPAPDGAATVLMLRPPIELAPPMEPAVSQGLAMNPTDIAQAIAMPQGAVVAPMATPTLPPPATDMAPTLALVAMPPPTPEVTPTPDDANDPPSVTAAPASADPNTATSPAKLTLISRMRSAASGGWGLFAAACIVVGVGGLGYSAYRANTMDANISGRTVSSGSDQTSGTYDARKDTSNPFAPGAAAPGGAAPSPGTAPGVDPLQVPSLPVPVAPGPASKVPVVSLPIVQLPNQASPVIPAPVFPGAGKQNPPANVQPPTNQQAAPIPPVNQQPAPPPVSQPQPAPAPNPVATAVPRPVPTGPKAPPQSPTPTATATTAQPTPTTTAPQPPSTDPAPTSAPQPVGEEPKTAPESPKAP